MTQIDHGVAGSAVCGLLSPYDALCVWRSHQEAVGRPGIEAVKDVYLMQIARGDDLSSARAITQRLPRSLAPFADEIAAVVTSAWSGRQARGRRTSPTHQRAPESLPAPDPSPPQAVTPTTATPEAAIPAAPGPGVHRAEPPTWMVLLPPEPRRAPPTPQ